MATERESGMEQVAEEIPQPPLQKSTEKRQAPPVVSTKMTTAWKKPSATSSILHDGPPKTNLADIMAEQMEDRAATQQLYGTDMSQEHLFQSLASQRHSESTANYEESKEQTSPSTHLQSYQSDALDEEAMLEMVMKQSLAEYNAAQKDRDTTTTQDDAPSPASHGPNASSSVAGGSTKTTDSYSRMSSVQVEEPDAQLQRAESEPIQSNNAQHRSALDREFSERTMRDIERTEVVIDTPQATAREKKHRLDRQSSESDAIIAIHSWSTPLERSTSARNVPTRNQLMETAKEHLSLREIEEIQQAIRESEMPQTNLESEHQDSEVISSTAMSIQERASDGFLSADEAAAIQAAIAEADAKAESESLALAYQMQEELNRLDIQQTRGGSNQGHVRTMTRSQLENESQRVAEAYGSNTDGWLGAMPSSGPPRAHPLESSLPNSPSTPARPPVLDAVARVVEANPLEEEQSAGFRMNAWNPHSWVRRDRNTIVGPTNEVRTKHDVYAQGQANAHLLGLDADDFGVRAHVGNKAFNSFKKTMKTKTKGVATHGTGRAGSDSDGIKGKAMDANVRLQISKAINNGLLEHCNGAVKQGKEAIVYHGEQGEESGGHDVAVKVFKRMTQFRSRGDYVDGDPRYAGRVFRKASDREQLEIWAEKEYRNLVRANRAKVPVPTPLHYKDNIIFMRFMGNDGWPAPQIGELDMRKGSQKWDILYTQVMEAVRRLYVGARLVHGDLSEYNILIAAAFQVENTISSRDDSSQDLQAVLIDFGQAVEIRHPEAMNLLKRDLDRVRSFFSKNGVKTMTLDDSVEFVIADLKKSQDSDVPDDISEEEEDQRKLSPSS